MSNNNTVKRTIDYTSYDFDVLRQELIGYLQETNSFKDAEYVASNIRTWVDISSYIGSLFGYYINSAANEVFLPTAKKYKNLNKIAQLLRYDPRGKISANVDVIGSLNPEYVYGKENQFIEIPAYSIFPSSQPTKTGEDFSFTNPTPITHMVKSYGVNFVQEEDLSYKGYSFPFTAPRSFFTADLSETGEVVIDPTGISLPLSLQKPLSIIVKTSEDGYHGFDTENYPMSDPSNSQSVGQPFTKTVNTVEYGSAMVPNVIYYLVFNYDRATASPYMTIVENINSLGDKQNDIICSFILEPTDSTENFYTLRVEEMETFSRFYVGVLGLINLESVAWEFDELAERSDAVERIKLVINKDGNSEPFSVLLGGRIFTFTSGTIYSQKFPKDFFDASILEYNVNLIIEDENDQANNYGARLEVTSNPPIANQITIAKINTKFADPETDTTSIKKNPGKKFGDFQVSKTPPATTSEQKAGRVFFKSGETVQKITFNAPFELAEGETNVEYHIALTPDNNVRTWWANKTTSGFNAYVEPNTQYEGYVSWTATRVIQQKLISVPVVFNQPIPTSVTVDGNISNYMVQLTPNENVQVWYDNLGPNGFEVKAELDFQGKVSWSVFNYFENDTVPSEPESGYRQRGQVKLRGDTIESGLDVTLENSIPDENYAIQLIPNKNVNVFYTNKKSGSFKINVEPGINEEVTVDWYVDSTNGYSFQRHGEIEFKGRTIESSNIPGLYFVNVPETFEINGLIQGSVAFTSINSNTVIDQLNNGLNLEIDPSRTSENDVRYIIKNVNVSTNGIRVFVKNDSGTWDEWERGGTGYNADTSPGNKTFLVRVNADRYAMIEFGDGVSWGETPINKESLIIGVLSVGKEGNINKGVMSPNVILSRYILGNDRTTVEFEKSFVDLLGLKSQQFFDGNLPDTSIIDSENTKLKTNDLTIQQNKNAFGGNEIETVDELRKNASNYFLRQGRNVSLGDYERFSEEVFSDYIAKTKTLTYKQIKQAGLISETELEKYWFNFIFIVALNKDGTNFISKSLRDSLLEQLDNSSAKMIGTEHEIVAATWVPIDVVIRYKKTKFGNAEVIETDMKKNITDFFSIDNHELGSRINSSDIDKLINLDNVESFEVMLNRDDNNRFTYNDYRVEVFEADGDPEKVRRNRLMSLVAKDPSLVKVFQPLFDTMKLDGTQDWNYSLYIQLSEFEFPKLGDIIIQREE